MRSTTFGSATTATIASCPPPPSGASLSGNGGIRYDRSIMTHLTVDLPPGVPADEARLAMAVKLYELGRLSLGQAATAAGFSKRAFMEMLGKLGVPVIAYPARDLEDELRE